MIRHEEVIDLMEGKIPYTQETLSGLSNLIKEYPYFQAAYLLYTLNLQRLNNTYTSLDVHKAAIYVPDRKKLFFQVEAGIFEPERIELLEKETQWMNSPSQLIDAFLSQEEENPESTPATIDYVPYLFFSDTTENEETPPLKYQDIIDKFLEEDAISPIKINLRPANESGKEMQKSIPELPKDDGAISESMAKIYIRQKKYDKALEIIRKLNLIFPEKSRYFADQIRFLEKLIIYTNKTN